MEKSKAIESLKAELERFGLVEKGWSYDLDRARSRLGVCKPYQKKIALSEVYVEYNKEELVLDTIRHEVAHALVAEIPGGARVGHGPIWKNMCLKVGARPIRCKREAVMPARVMSPERRRRISAMRKLEAQGKSRYDFHVGQKITVPMEILRGKSRFLAGKVGIIKKIGSTRVHAEFPGSQFPWNIPFNLAKIVEG